MVKVLHPLKLNNDHMSAHHKHKTEARQLSVVLSEMGVGSRQQAQRLEHIKQRRDSAYAEKDAAFLSSLRTGIATNKRIDLAQRHMDRLHKWQRLLLSEEASGQRARSRSRSRSRSPSLKELAVREREMVFNVPPSAYICAIHGTTWIMPAPFRVVCCSVGRYPQQPPLLDRPLCAVAP